MDSAHKQMPVPKAAILSLRVAAELENIMLSAMANMKKPAPATSYPFLKKYGVSNAAANIKALLSIAHRIFRIVSEGTKVPIIPNTQPIKSPMAAIRTINF